MSGIREALIAAVREETEYAIRIDAEFTEAEYVVNRVERFFRESGYRIVAVDDLTALLDEIAYWAPMEGCRSESIAALDRIEALIGGE